MIAIKFIVPSPFFINGRNGEHIQDWLSFVGTYHERLAVSYLA